MIETELKAMLSYDQYEILMDMFTWDSAVSQTNHYYTDKSGELKNHGITFRIRTIDNKSVIQVKKHTNSNSPLQICEENEFEIDFIPQEFSQNEIKEMTGIEISTSYIGDLTTIRNSCMYCDGVEICLDKNDYLDTTDYEIEIEYTSPIPDELLTKLAEAGVTFNKPSRGKFSRFMTQLLSII